MIRTGLALLALLLLSAPVAAQERVLPVPYRAIWAAPSCAAPAQVLVTSALFALSAGPDSARIDPLAVRASGDDYIKVEQGGESFFLALDDDDKLTVTALRVRNGIWPARLDPFNPALTVRTFEKCEKTPVPWASLHPDGLAAFFALDRLLRVCVAKDMTADCAYGLFSAADQNRDDRLDIREMAVAWRRMIYLAGASGCAFPDIFPDDTAQTGPAIAAHALRDGDTDSDYRLSFEEMRAATPAELMRVSANLRAYLPSLPRGPSPFCTP